jgi:uncharacterized membrane protein (DUF4010 family)
MDLPQPYLGLIAALAAGLLVGMERGYAQRDLGEGRRAAGFRTFGLIGLAGGLSALAPDIVAAVMALGVIAAVVAGYVMGARQDSLSATTSIAGVLTFGIGVAAVRLSPGVALAAAAAAFVILRSRQSMHGMLRGLNEAELEAVARFVMVALVAMPFLPDVQMGPFNALNPRRIWMVVVFVLGLSFVGYAVARRYGSNRGILFVALTGALVSSTAVTADYARRLRNEPDTRGPLTAGIALASIVMFVRVQLLAAVLVPSALRTLALAMAPATLVAALGALVAWRGGKHASDSQVVLANPLGFGPAFLLAGLVAILSLVANWALASFGNSGIAIVLGITGMSDVDAAVLTMAGLPAGALDARMAGLILAIPILANTAIKAGMATVIAWGHGGTRAAMPLYLSLLASGAALAWAAGIW